MPQVSISTLPEKLRLFVLDAHSYKPLQGIPIRLSLGLHKENDGDYAIPIGVLASDHAGYLSFDLPSGDERNSLYDWLTNIWLDPFLDENRRIDLISHFDDKVTPTDGIPVALDTATLPRSFGSHSLPSIPNPDVTDWRVSPASFGTANIPIIGENGCETLLPSNTTERLFKFHQLTRVPSLGLGRLIHIGDYGEEFGEAEHPPLEYRRGKLLQYDMTWQPVNHGLGQVLYSLTLAPCESVNIAVIDRAREERAEREEGTGITEQLAHDQRRDRVIEESVEAALQE